jgi:hypothetical protein
MKTFNYKNDHLLLKDKKFINKKLNLYGALIKKEDMIDNHKGTILKKCPYLFDEKNNLKEILESLKDKNFKTLRNNLAEYLEVKSIRKDTFESWINKRIYPLQLIRVIAYLLNQDTLKNINDKIITDFCIQSKIKFPSEYNTINSNFMAYFFGLHLGDGTLNKERWKIVDGDRELLNLEYSFNFLNKIKNKISSIFSIDSAKIYKLKNKNAYELVISNKWFSRYLNFVYGIEQNEKEKLEFPDLFKSKKEFILRGLFDTDGSIKEYRVAIGTKYMNLNKEISKILTDNKIDYKERYSNAQRGNVFYIIEIKKEFISKFINKVGFSHPRKLYEIRKYLLTNSSSWNFKRYRKTYKPQIEKREFIELCKYLRPMKNAGKVRFISEFDKLDNKNKERIINNFKKNFCTLKEPNNKGYVHSREIERIITNYCIFVRKRFKTNEKEITEITKRLNSLWD